MTFHPATRKNTATFPLSRYLTLAGLTGLALASLCLPVFASDGVVRNIRYDQASRHFLIDTSGSVNATVNSLNIAGHKRIIIDVDNAEIGIELPRDVQLLQDMARQMPAVRNLTVNQYGGNGRPIVRILLDLQGDPGNVRVVHNQGPHIELELNESAAYQPGSSTPGSRSLDMPPSLAGLKQQTDLPTQTAQRPLVNPAPSSTHDAVSREMYNRSIQYQQEQKRQLDALQREIEQLKANSANSGIASDDLKRTLAILNQKYESLLQENQYLKSRVDSGAQNQQLSQSEQQRLNGELDRLKSANATLQNRVSTLLSEQARPNPQLSASQTELTRLKSENRTLQARIEQQATQLASPQNSTQLEELKRKLDEMTRRNDSLAQENIALQGKLSSAQAKPNPAFNAQQAEIDRLKADKANLEARINLLSAKTSASSGAEISDVDLQNLKKQLTLAQQSLNESIRTINEQNKEIAYLRNQVSDVKAGMDASAREQIAHLQSVQDEKDATILDLQRQIASKPTASSGSGGASPANTAEIASLKRQLDKITQQYQTDVQDLNRQLQERNTQLVSAQGKASQANDLQEQVQSLRQQLAATSQKNNASQTSQVPASEVQRRDSQIATLRAEITQLKTTKGDTAALNGKIAALQTELASLQSVQKERDAAQQELASVKSDLEQLQSNGASSKKSSASLKEAMDKLNRENQDLHHMLDSLQQAANSGSGESSRQSKTQLAALQKELAEARAEAQKATQDANKAKQDLLFTQKSAENKPTAAPVAKQDPKQLAELNRQLADLRKENDTLKTKLSQATPTPASAAANPEAEADYVSGKAAMDSKNLSVAIDKFKEAQLLEPNNSKYAIEYSIALAEDHQYAEAIDSLRRYLQRNPIDRDAYNQLGKLYLLNDQADAASQAFSRAMSVSTLNNYATSLKKLGRTDDAESIFKLALSLNPKDSEVLFNLGNLYNSENKLELARNRYLEAIQIKPDFAEAHYNLGLIFSKLGDNAKAVSHLEKFLQLSPNARNAETIRAYVQKLKA